MTSTQPTAITEPCTNQPIEQVAYHSPLYELPHVSQHERVFTVTVAGPGRHDGEKPYTYVAAAHSTIYSAWPLVLELAAR